MIILTPQQAAQVRGPTSNGARLEPRALLLGNFALPEAVLQDANHQMWWSLLSGLPRRPVLETEFPVELLI